MHSIVILTYEATYEAINDVRGEQQRRIRSNPGTMPYSFPTRTAFCTTSVMISTVDGESAHIESLLPGLCKTLTSKLSEWAPS